MYPNPFERKHSTIRQVIDRFLKPDSNNNLRRLNSTNSKCSTSSYGSSFNKHCRGFLYSSFLFLEGRVKKNQRSHFCFFKFDYNHRLYFGKVITLIIWIRLLFVYNSK
ncbi:hypothetical protein O3M35_008681 [Rhynocoris fuscipes]|uniref:Maturase K n=1 Tax=Rhynocoris fuscipes TaxID=488301 RepID=A0AAW1DAL1_9HEMI